MRARTRAAAILLAGAAACAPAPDAVYDPIVVVTLDTLRADHLGAYGYPRPTSPFFDELAAEGVLFERAYAPISTTVPSHATLFTALEPVQHRVLRNGLVLGDAFETLAERFAGQGFATAAFVATRAQFGPANLDQGFEVFDQPGELGEEEVYRPADRTVDAVLAWLEREAPARPLFLWVHLFDVHGPLQPPAEHEKRFALRSDADRRALLAFLVQRHGAQPKSFVRGVAAVLDEHVRYDAEIHFADTELRRLRAGLERLGRGDRALWVVAGDHGQGLTRRERRGHGRHIYEEQIRVPLLFHAADGSLPPRRVAGVAALVDVTPTILELAGLAPATSARGLPLQGRSLVPALRGGPVGVGRRILVQRRSYSQEGPPERGEYELGEKFALVDQRWKYVHRTIGADELYDLRRDPHETRNLVSREPERAATLARALETRLQALRPAQTEAPSVDAETLEQLEAMGYVQ